jgi:hypothetical protein
MVKTMTHIPKGALKKDSHNLNAMAYQNYFVIEDVAQNPCATYAMEVLQSFPSQRKTLFSSLGAAETTNLGMIFFYPRDYKPPLPHHVAFQIVMAYAMKSLTHNILLMVFDEGALNYMMSLACSKAIGQTLFSPSPTLLTEFDK